MERVQGIGGIFVRAQNRKVLACWYRDHLGIDVDEAWWGHAFVWSAQDRPESAATVWSAFPQDSEYFGRPEQAFMINFRVRDLDAMLAQLRAAGCDVADELEDSGLGRFGWVTDPEGNRVELWQPPTTLPG